MIAFDGKLFFAFYLFPITFMALYVKAAHVKRECFAGSWPQHGIRGAVDETFLFVAINAD